MIWTSVPLTILVSSVLGYVWIHHLDPPEAPEIAEQYGLAVTMICVAVTLETFNEVFWIFSQMFLFVKFRSSMEFLYVFGRAVIMIGIVLWFPDKAVVGNSLATVVVVLLQAAAFNTYFYLQIRNRKKTDLPFESLRDLYPSPTDWIHQERLTLTVSFFKQGIFKQLLTEGERYMFTWFSLMTLAQQGIYDVVSSFGAMAARLIFSKVEEAAYFYFSQTVTRGEAKDEAEVKSTAIHLHNLLRAMTLLGLVVCIFGQGFSHALLHLYGGTRLSEGMGPPLLQAQSVFVLFMAVNGITECFAFAAMTSKQVENYNKYLAVMTAIFLSFSYVFAKAFGPVGFVLANCVNFSMRIAHNCRVIRRRFAGQAIDPLLGTIPGSGTMVTLVVSGVVCKASEMLVYDCQSIPHFLAHIAIGGLCFLVTIGQILWSEAFLRDSLVSALKSKKLI